MLSPEQTQQFASQGFLVIPGFESSDFCQSIIALAKAELQRDSAPIEYEADTNYPGAPSSRNAEGGKTARRLLGAYGRSPLLARWATSTRLRDPLQQLLGTQVYLSQCHHNCIMTKQPAYSSRTGWHRDSRYWHFARPALVSAWLALGNEHHENGCLWVIPASHTTNVDAEQLDQRQFLRTDLEQNKLLLDQAIAVPLNQGDLLLFHSNLFHAAGRNMTGNTKYSLVFTYRDANNLPKPDTRSSIFPDIQLG